ncbi:hypothetical protein BC832DRAFT_42617 [Gaertneriomyces semiglobifer]|nr:hypothetical protein BC832DRAFT_42617 [Gaertneriomyces semiglobifer]
MSKCSQRSPSRSWWMLLLCGVIALSCRYTPVQLFTLQVIIYTYSNDATRMRRGRAAGNGRKAAGINMISNKNIYGSPVCMVSTHWKVSGWGGCVSLM